MNIIYLIFIVLPILEGCAKHDTYSTSGQNYTYVAERRRLIDQPIPLPTETPYDWDINLRSVYIFGFSKGWNIALKYWLGNSIIIPNEYQSKNEIKAWREGWMAAQHAIYDRVRAISAP